jgi:uncharacterized protein
MTLEQRLKEKRQEILRIAAEHGALNVRVFGSVARGEADKSSDIDFLVDMEPRRSLFDLGGLQYDLQAPPAAPWMSSPNAASRRASAIA